MCIVSMVYDEYAGRFPVRQTAPLPYVNPAPTENTLDWATMFQTKSQVEKMEELIKEFKEALEHAKKLDILMKKPDCEDPEKAKLLKRVEELEKAIAELKKTPKKKTKK